ncbi:hypothetical protein MUN84_21620 [Hymenobacter sp. 5516J-16]|uniref:LemA family protein n=1 Tax=Hymenobacter sublimis TaxID=2933777 RepID=A0ABY4JE54_9BACT|nr:MULTISPECIES: hypothetical protein [Hymenobacter]UOQ77029.1 hypothetical protein MUN84_21620 [Hymenobacter sp. 5516J-16]UPL50716.1 hypothetical protein MWH26_07390 [Hymenobacter sublimis]
MNKTLPLLALLIALGLIIFLYQRLRTTEAALEMAQKRFADCEQVNFQLQSQLVQATRGPVPDSLKITD